MPYFQLKVEKRGLMPVVTYNGVPLPLDELPPDGDPGTMVDEVNKWTLAGRNTLAVRLAWPPPVEFEPGRVSLRLGLAELGDNQAFEQADSLAVDFRWPPPIEGRAGDEPPDRPTDYPLERSFAFEVTDSPPSELWPQARRLVMTSRHQQAVLKLIEELYRALAAGDAATAARLLAFRNEETYRASYLNPAEAASDFETLIGMVAADPGFAMDLPWADVVERLELKLVGNGRLVWIARRDGEAALKSSPEAGVSLSLGLYAAPLAGKWTFVR